jgi:hypothetical protein
MLSDLPLQLLLEPWLTFLMFKALQVFEKTFGLIPGLGVDIKISHSGAPYIPYYNYNRKNSVLHSLLILQQVILCLGILKPYHSHEKFSGHNLVKLGVVILSLIQPLTILLLRRNIIKSNGLLRS